MSLYMASPLQLNRLLQLCTHFGLIYQGTQVHQQIIVHGFHHHPFMLTKLVQFYAKLGLSLFAHTLFDKMPHPNVFAWTAILTLYSGNKCSQMYTRMKAMGVKPDNYVFPKVLRACSYLQDFLFGIQIHCDVITHGAQFATEVCNSLIDMYSKTGDIESSRRVFDGIVYKDLLSWNSMISGYVYNRFHQSAVELLSLMRLDGFEPDTVTLNTVIDAFCQMGQFDEALNTFQKIEKPNIISWTTLMLAYSKIGRYEVALEIFRDMMIKGENRPDLGCVSIVIVCSRYLNALKCGREAHAYGIKTEDMISFYESVGPALLVMYAKCGRRINDAGKVFDMMDKHDIVAWNAMISGFSDLGMRKKAIDCCREMHRMGILSNEMTMSSILASCDLKYGKEIHAYFIKSNSFASSVHVLNALIHMYSKCGCIKTASLIFSKMESKDLVSWNTMIAGLGNHGLGRTAIEVLSNMIGCGFGPDSVTFTSLLSACSHSGLVDEGVEIFERMRGDFGIEPSIEHFASVADLLARSGRVEEALLFVKKMRTVKPDKRIWGALLVSSQACENFDVARLASKHLIWLEPENAGHYVTLANICASQGRWEDCASVRKLMESRGSIKPSGLSWFGLEPTKC